ncbi:MAG: hypothetical protein PHQ43_14945, partial [Dehalococcoidales bacterium]|nr:hypothetical protein [Dehalococcoidales bacterium]
GEGYTAAGWDEYLLIQNPNNEEITVNGDFLIKGKGKSPFVAKVKPNSRATYLVDSYVPEGSELGMALRCSRGFIAERAMYFDYSMRNSILTGGHDCFGGTYGNMFLFAEGYTGTTWDEYLTLANPNTEAISVRVQFMVEGAANPDPFDVEVAAGNRSTVRVKDHVGENTNVSTSLSSDSSFIAERPMYFIYENSIAGGDCVIGYTP